MNTDFPTRKLKEACPECGKAFHRSGLGPHRARMHHVYKKDYIPPASLKLSPTEVVNQIMDNPNEFVGTIELAIQSLQNKVVGLLGDIEVCKRQLERLENFKASITSTISKISGVQ